VTASGATWGQDVAVCRLLQSEVRPWVTSDGIGGWVVAWRDDRVASQFNLYAQRLNGAGVPQWAVDGQAVCTSQFVRHLALTSNALGSVVVAWSDGRAGTAQVYGQRLAPSGVPQWTANGVLLSTTQMGDTYGSTPRVIKDASDGAIIVWSDGFGGTQAHAQRVTADGMLLWSNAGQLLWPAATSAAVEAVVGDQVGGAIVLGKTNLGLRGQRLDSNGNRVWGTSGATLSMLESPSLVSDAVPDGNGGAVFAHSVREVSTFDDDLYAGRVSSGGTVEVKLARPLSGLLSIDGVVPNPSTGAMWVHFTLPSKQLALVELIDLQGRRLVHEEFIPAGGRFSTVFNAHSVLSPGVYFVRLEQAGLSKTRRVVVSR
jgi:hypothetical protein